MHHRFAGAGDAAGAVHDGVVGGAVGAGMGRDGRAAAVGLIATDPYGEVVGVAFAALASRRKTARRV